MGIMTVITILGVAASAKTAHDSKSARKNAARELTTANIENAEMLQRVGREAEGDILLAQNQALESVASGLEEASSRIRPFVEPGQRAFGQAQENILFGQDITGPLADAIKAGSVGAIRPEIFDTSGPVANEIQRQGDISVSGATPLFTESLLTAGKQGLSATADIGGIKQRGFERAGDILGATGAQRASVLVGQTPQLLELSKGAAEGRLLEEVGGQRFDAAAIGKLSELAGRFA